MTQENTHIQLILKCNLKGIAEEVIHDNIGFFQSITLPAGVHNFVASDSIESFGGFWVNVTNNTMEENVALALKFHGATVKFTFSGYLLKDKVLLCGNTELAAVEKALEEIMIINNEQLNHIRTAQKKISKLQQDIPHGREPNQDMLNDFTRVNNELINQQRELARKHQEIEKLNKDLEKSGENMEMFAYSISHDLKEPLRMVKSFIELFVHNYNDTLDEVGKSYIGYALDGATRMEKMILDLLHFYKATESQPGEWIDLNETIQDIKNLLSEKIEESAAAINIDPLPVVKGSSTGLQQVFQNLISNAIKFVPEEQQPIIKIGVKDQGDNWQFAVADNGVGIPEEKQKDIFRLFQRTGDKGQFEGSGMGLAIVKRIIENNWGEIWIDSEKGKGSTFYFTLPKRSDAY